MRNPTFTFGDLANNFIDMIPERKCEIEPFLHLSVERYPTTEEKKENPNVWMIVENDMFFYRPFRIETIEC
jgi:hypothetical protein